MANEPIYDVASFDGLTKLCSAQTVVENRLLPMGGVSISKVLSHTADCFVSVSEAFTGEVRAAGRVYFRVIFIDNNGISRTMETGAEFTDKVCDDAIGSGVPVILSRVLDIDIVSVSEGEIKLAAIVEMDLYSANSSRIKYMQSGGDGVFIRDERIDGQRLVGKISDTLSISDEVKVSADKLLTAESVVVTRSIKANLGSVTVEGEVISSIVTESEGEINSYRLVTPFAHQMGLDGVTDSSVVTGNAMVSSIGSTLKYDEESSESAVVLDLTLAFSAFGFSHESLSPASDAFSMDSELSLEISTLPITVVRGQLSVCERVEGAVSLKSDMPLADKILAACGSKLNVTNSYIQGGRLVLEGAVSSSVIYFSSETGTKNSVEVELPFAITTIEAAGQSVLLARGEVSELSLKIRRGSEIDIKADICVSVVFADRTDARFVSSLELGEAIAIPAAAISLHIARRNESLWDVAKALKTTPELILLQNPDLELPLVGGERIIIYRHVKKG